MMVRMASAGRPETTSSGIICRAAANLHMSVNRKLEAKNTLDALRENEQCTVVAIRQACVESDGNPPAGSVLDVTNNIRPQ